MRGSFGWLRRLKMCWQVKSTFRLCSCLAEGGLTGFGSYGFVTGSKPLKAFRFFSAIALGPGHTGQPIPAGDLKCRY